LEGYWSSSLEPLSISVTYNVDSKPPPPVLLALTERGSRDSSTQTFSAGCARPEYQCAITKPVYSVRWPFEQLLERPHWVYTCTALSNGWHTAHAAY
jgi:hypothetical protein